MPAMGPYGGSPYGGETVVSGRTASDTIAFFDSAAPAGAHTHLSASDTIVFSDAVGWSGTIAPQPSLYQRIPGVGARATPGTRNPVNFPRTFKVSRVAPPEQVSYGAYDFITFSDSAGRTPMAYAKTASDTLSFSDHAQIKLAARDTLTFSDAAVGPRIAASSDTLTFSDAATRAPLGYNRTSADALSFSDHATGTTGHNVLSCSDTLHFSDGMLVGISDTFTFSDIAAHGPVFFSANDTLSFSDTVSISGLLTNARVYQVYSEVIFQATDDFGYGYQMVNEVAMVPPSTAFDYQTGLEVAVKPPANADGLQFVEEVAVGKIYGQIWPIGWGQTRRRYGQIWPRWSRKYGGGMAED